MLKAELAENPELQQWIAEKKAAGYEGLYKVPEKEQRIFLAKVNSAIAIHCNWRNGFITRQDVSEVVGRDLYGGELYSPVGSVCYDSDGGAEVLKRLYGL